LKLGISDYVTPYPKHLGSMKKITFFSHRSWQERRGEREEERERRGLMMEGLIFMRTS
jgi:hypothetical protein